jgi:hypothetical protein
LSQLPVVRLGEQELTSKGLAYLVANHPTNWLRDTQSSRFAPQAAEALLARQQRWRLEMAALQQRRN